MQGKELRIQASMMFVGEDFKAVLYLLSQGKIPTDKIATVTLPLVESERVFRLASEART
jgi:threonine dehydrogenase-like Zn-dependent dehydrogenase